MRLLEDITQALAETGKEIAQLSEWASWTARVRANIADLAGKYASERQIACGPQGINPGGMRLAVCHHGGIDPEFLFDQCWLVFFDQANEPSDQSTEPKDGYLCSCELAIETAWFNVDSSEFYRDFQRLLVAKARVKVFVFRAPSRQVGDSVIRKLGLQISCFGGAAAQETHLLAFYTGDACYHLIVPSQADHSDAGRSMSAMQESAS